MAKQQATYITLSLISSRFILILTNIIQPGIQRLQTCTHSHFAFALCCHSNAIRAPIANLPTSAQLGGIPYHSPDYIWVRTVVWACGPGQIDRHTDRRAWPLYGVVSGCSIGLELSASRHTTDISTFKRHLKTHLLSCILILTRAFVFTLQWFRLYIELCNTAVDSFLQLPYTK